MRIVSLVPHATELLFALGAGDEVLGVTHECDHPPEAPSRRQLTRDVLPAGLDAAGIDAAVRERTLDGAAIYELDHEALADLQPELIVTQALCPVCAVSYEEVAELALALPGPPRVIALDPKTLEETLEDVGTLAQASDHSEQGAALVGDAQARIERVKLAVADLPRPRVAALEWLDPIYAAGHWTPQMIELAGGEDIFGHAGEPSRTLSAVALTGAQPQLVLVMPCGYDAARAHQEALAHAGALAALGGERIVAVDAAAYFSRPGPRLIEGLELLAALLHPGRFGEVPTARALTVELDGARL